MLICVFTCHLNQSFVSLLSIGSLVAVILDKLLVYRVAVAEVINCLKNVYKCVVLILIILGSDLELLEAGGVVEYLRRQQPELDGR